MAVYLGICVTAYLDAKGYLSEQIPTTAASTVDSTQGMSYSHSQQRGVF